MPRQPEPGLNNALCDLLRRMMSACEVRSENTGILIGHSGRRPDVLITAPGRSPVVVEAEYEPAAEAEEDARGRLGLEVEDGGRPVEAAVALRYPQAVRDAYDAGRALAEARLSWCVLREGGVRFPESGWLEGSATDLADLIRLVSVPQKEVDEATDAFEQGVGRAAAILDEENTLRPGMTNNIAAILELGNIRQTRRMACAILANAMVFHERVAGIHPDMGINSLIKLRDPALREGILTEWRRILEVNYFPIFDIAARVLEEMPSGPAARILTALRAIAERVEAAGVTHAHDLTGQVFQKLIADRKYLATFYTRPASAALLARLAVAKMKGVDWACPEAVGGLRVADFACGTGALLSAVYDQMAARHERAGGDAAALHPAMMEEVLYGCDVMPSAVHLTSATLSGVQPAVGYGSSRIYAMPYGRQDDGAASIGSLELLDKSRQLILLNMNDPARRVGSAGEEDASQNVVEFPDEGFDLVIMNPPFTRAGSDWEGDEREGDTVKQFRGLGSDPETQKEMSSREKRFARDTCAHGYAGIASSFAALGNRKLRPGGALALVLPLSAATGVSWEKFRRMITDDYTDLEVVSIAANGGEISFSADTGMAECLVIARKREAEDPPARRARFVSLRRRPQSFVHAAEIAKSIHAAADVRRIDEGPYGGAPLMVGGEAEGEMLTPPCSANGETWAGVRVSDYSLVQTAHALADSRLWLPGVFTALKLKTAPLNHVGRRGLYHRNIAGASSAPFIRMKRPSPTATYPCLWSHDAKKETRMVCEPDSELRVRRGMEKKAAEAWATASRAHLTLDFRFNSQPLAAAFTKGKSIGGTAWPNVFFPNEKFDYAFVVWCNSTLGLLKFWWYSNLQHGGRGRITISVAETLSILDLRALNDEQLAVAEEIFEEFREKELKPAYLADADPNRALLDRRVICDLLGFDEGVYQGARRLAVKWCAEPSVHGGKKRPPGSEPVT